LQSHPNFSRCPYGPMDKAPAYGAGDSGFESQYGLSFCIFLFFVLFCLFVFGLYLLPVPSSRLHSRLVSTSVCSQPIKSRHLTCTQNGREEPRLCISRCLYASTAARATKSGVMRESNSRPPAPEAGIIPLDQSPNLCAWKGSHLTRQRERKKGRMCTCTSMIV
jgi:hypothetical protein